MNPNATITDEMFEAYLKQIRELVEGPFEEMQKGACRRSSLVVLVACVCTFIMRQT